MRASDAEREAVIDRLRDAAGEGRLTFEELADRIETAAQAETLEELDQVTEDLPAPPAAAPPAIAPRPTHASSVFGDVHRAGTWSVPAEGRWLSLFGDVVLDLREARIAGPDTQIDAGTIFGDVELLVPEGVDVEVRSRTVFGALEQEAGDAAPRHAPRIVLRGGSLFGDVRIRAQRLRELRPRLGS